MFATIHRHGPIRRGPHHREAHTMAGPRAGSTPRPERHPGQDLLRHGYQITSAVLPISTAWVMPFYLPSLALLVLAIVAVRRASLHLA